MPVTQTMTQTMPLTATLAMTASILKLRIGSFVALAGLVGILTSGGTMGWVQAMIFTLAVLGASGAAGAYNQYYERETDKLMARTFNRPFARGLLRPGPVWPLTFLALLAGSLAMAWSVGGTLATVLVFLGAATYAIVYTVWLKRRSVWNVVIGGASGSFAMLAGAAAASDPYGPVIGPVPLLLAGALFLWTPPHFWALAVARKADYEKAEIPMLPVTHGEELTKSFIVYYTILLIIVTLLPYLTGMSGPLYLFAAVALGAGFLFYARRLKLAPGSETGMKTFSYSISYLMALFVFLLIDHYMPAIWPA